MTTTSTSGADGLLLTPGTTARVSPCFPRRGAHTRGVSAWRTAAAATLALVARTACSADAEPGRTARPSASTTEAGLPTPDHVMVVIFENEDAQNIVGGPEAPYL